MSEVLVEFLRARLDDDEQMAHAAGGTWINGLPTRLFNDVLSRTVLDVDRDGFSDHVCGSIEAADAEHIARHDPARVSAEVAAKRALLAEHEPDVKSWGTFCTCCADNAPYDPGQAGWPCRTVLLLAAPFAGHPDFDPVWAVSDLLVSPPEEQP